MDLFTAMEEWSYKARIVQTCESLTSMMAILRNEEFIAVDVETTTVDYFNLKLVGIGFATNDRGSWYIPIGHKIDHPQLKIETVISTIQELFDSPSRTMVGHNLKFDAFFLVKEGLDLRIFEWYDTMIAARVLRNDLRSLSLDSLTGKKNDLKTYINENKLYTTIESPFKKQKTKLLHYDKVPFEIIKPYAENDVIITRELYLTQNQQNDTNNCRVIENEMKLLKVIFNMELRGIKINIDFTKRALKFSQNESNKYKQKFMELSGYNDPATRKNLVKAFDNYDIPTTQKGNPRIDSAFLESLNCELAQVVLAYRDAEKRANTYYGNYLELSENNRINFSLNQHGTDTGRMSSSNPNMQNIHKKDGSDFPVRSCFTPDNDYYFLCIDYDSMELRKVYDLAGEKEICDSISAGLDPHEAIAKSTSLTREDAKTLNYALLYGAGIRKISMSLNKTMSEARIILNNFYKKAPKLKSLIYKINQIVSEKGYIYNWFGRKYYFNEFNQKDAVSKVIQGGCADIVKTAMVEIDEFLKPYKTHMLLQVHDELVFQLHKDEVHLVDKIKEIMENVYQGKYLKLTCSVSIKKNNWGEK